MWTIPYSLPPGVLSLDGAAAAGAWFLCWHGSSSFGWSRDAGWIALPPLDRPPSLVRTTKEFVLVIVDAPDAANGPERHVARWRPGSPAWDWISWIAWTPPGKRSFGNLVAAGGSLLAIRSPEDSGAPVLLWELTNSGAKECGAVYGDFSQESFFAGGEWRHGPYLLAVSQQFVWEVGVWAGDAWIKSRREGRYQDAFTPASEPVVAGNVVVWDDRRERHLFNLETLEWTRTPLAWIPGAAALWPAWASGSVPRTLRLLDALLGVPRPSPDAAPLAVLEAPDRSVAVATTRGVGALGTSPASDFERGRHPVHLFDLASLLEWRTALDPEGTAGPTVAPAAWVPSQAWTDPGVEGRRSALMVLERSGTVPQLEEAAWHALGDPDAGIRDFGWSLLAELAPRLDRCQTSMVLDALFLAGEASRVARLRGGSDQPWPRLSGGDPEAEVETLLSTLLAEANTDDDDSPVEAAGDITALLLRLFYQVWLDGPVGRTSPPESGDAPRWNDWVDRIVTIDSVVSFPRNRTRECQLGSLRNGPPPFPAAARSALAVASAFGSDGGRCLLFVAASQPLAGERLGGSGSSPGAPLHTRLAALETRPLLGRCLDSLRRAALAEKSWTADPSTPRSVVAAEKSFEAVALWFLASRGDPEAFEELHRRLPVACATWRALVPAWALLSPDERTTRDGIREVLLSPAPCTAFKVQIQAGFLPDPLVDGKGPELLPFFEEVARDASIPIGERRRAAHWATQAGNARSLIPTPRPSSSPP